MSATLKRLPLIVAVLAIVGSSGCRFGELKDDLKVIASMATLRGTVTSVATEPAPILVVLIKDEGEARTVADYLIVRDGDEFEFNAFPGAYFLGAFRDSRQNLHRDEDELVAFYDDATRLEVTAGATLVDLDLHLESPLVGTIEDHVGTFRDELPLFKRNLGEVVSLEDDRFAPERGEDGLWTPVDFFFEIGGGIYFAEEFDPTRTPVLFIHGASGTPRDFAEFVSGLDRERYQAWLFYYPSGVRLGRIGPFLHEMVDELQRRLVFERLYVVAHSMGGLVARGYVNEYVADPRGAGYLRKLVSISTPWEGHKMAASGVKFAPQVVPSWRDMDPDSEFLAELYDPLLPEELDYYLLFGYKGDRGDGTIKLTSQLAPRAQAAAVKVLGFEEDHMSILKSEDALAALHEILAAD